MTSSTSKRLLRQLLLLLIVCLPSLVTASQDVTPVWTTESDSGRQVHLYFFWSRTCPHCQAALPVVNDLAEFHPWIVLHSHEITRSRSNYERYAVMAAQLGEEARSVPAFFVCGQFLTGFDHAGGRGQELLELARACRDDELLVDVADAPLSLPLLGEISAEELSLPMLTLVLAGVDAFNPCAFFVLLFLLGLLTHTRSTGRMLLIGGVFVFFSGLVYFLFMAAWLNLFLVVQGLNWVTALAGLVALLIGTLNTKDFFAFGKGPSLSMSDDSRSSLFRRMRRLLGTERLPVLLGATVLLALAANSYELLCTAGFPMVYTRALTLADLPGTSYYGYLLLYNVIYVLPLLAIVLAVSLTLGKHKMSEQQGRQLKLLSGLMMLGLGTVLLVDPTALNQAWVGLALLGSAILLTWLLTRWKRVDSSS